MKTAAIVVAVLPDTPEQWRDWWARTEPKLTEDLQLKQPAPLGRREYREGDFAVTPAFIELRAMVDEPEFRVGDPIKIEMAMENKSQSPYSLILPHVPSGWWPTMGYGIRLTRGKEVVMDLAPSGFYEGSYSGAPPFETLAPGETFRSATCFQRLLRGSVDLPLAEGDYELQIAFDSATFPGVKPVGAQLVHRWDAKPITFRIRGEARQDPQEILSVIGRKTGLKWIESDLTSRMPDRRKIAWEALYGFGDSRLRAFVEKIEVAHPEAKYHYLSARDLEPFASQPQRPAQ